MKFALKHLVALAMSSALSAPAFAQVATIASVNPIVAVAKAKAFQTANQQIETTYKATFDQIDQKLKERQTVLAQLDKNKDNQIDDAELKAAKLAKSPALKQLDVLETDVKKLQVPAILAQLYALESVTQKYEAAQNKVVADRHVGLLVRQEAVVFETPAADITDAVTAELDKSIPVASTTPPANWQPNQGTLQLLQQIKELSQRAAMVRPQTAQQQQQQPQGR